MPGCHGSPHRTGPVGGGSGRQATMPVTAALRPLKRSNQVTLGVAVALTILAGAVTAVHANAVIRFVVAGFALAALAALIGQAIEQVGERICPSATGLLQSTLG